MFAASNPSRVNIDEANKHLQLLMDRVNELEATVTYTVKEQTEALIRKDDQTAMQLNEMEKEANTSVGRLQRELRVSDNSVEELREMCRERDITITKLRQKAAVLDDILKYRPMMEKLTFYLVQGERVAADGAKDSQKEYKPIQGKGTSSNTSNSREVNGLPVSVDSQNSSPRHTSTPSHIPKSGSMKKNLAAGLLTGTSYGKPSTQDVLYSAFSFDGPSLQRDPADKELYL